MSDQTIIIASIVGIIVFYSLMYLFYRYASGEYAVRPEKQARYKNWVSTNGDRAKRKIKIYSIIFGLLMLLQLWSVI